MRRRGAVRIFVKSWLAAPDHGEQGSRHQRNHHDVYREEADEHAHRDEVDDARVVEASHRRTQERQLNRLPDSQA